MSNKIDLEFFLIKLHPKTYRREKWQGATNWYNFDVDVIFTVVCVTGFIQKNQKTEKIIS